MNIERNTLKNLLNEYAQQKAQLDMMTQNGEYDDDSTDIAYKEGFCVCAEMWMESIGVSKNCNMVTDAINKQLKR